MKAMLLRVVKCGEEASVKSESKEGGNVSKRTLVLQELGGKYENCYVVVTWNNLATIAFEEGSLVFATLQFRTHEFNGKLYQDIEATEIYKK